MGRCKEKICNEGEKKNEEEEEREKLGAFIVFKSPSQLELCWILIG